MIHPLSTPCSLIHRGTLSSRDAAQITCVRPNRIKTEPWACGATPGSIFTSRRSEALLPSRRSMEPGRLGPPRHGCKHLRTHCRHVLTDWPDSAVVLRELRSNLAGPIQLGKGNGRAGEIILPSHPSGSAIRLAPALFRAPRVAVELRSNPAGPIQLGKGNGRAGEIIPITLLPIGLCHQAGARTLSRSARRSRTAFEPRRTDTTREREWSGRRDSNSRPPRPERGALPS